MGQDRHLNVLSIINLLGPEGFKDFADGLEPLNLEHQIAVVDRE